MADKLTPKHPGGKITEQQVTALFAKKDRFRNEKEMCDYIERNIELFCEEVLEDKYESHQREYSLKWQRGTFKRGRPNTRFDFLITCENQTYIVEAKNPTQIYTEMSRAISQLMLYEMLAEDFGIEAKIVIVASLHSDIFLRMLKRFNLNYGYIVFNKHSSARLLGFEDDQ